MQQTILMGRGCEITSLAYEEWKKGIPVILERVREGLSFMSAEHRLIRNFVVANLTKAGKPLSPAEIARKVNLPMPQVVSILDDLEKHKVFLFRNGKGEVVWAYPVTAEETPHRVSFNTGENIFAA